MFVLLSQKDLSLEEDFIIANFLPKFLLIELQF